MTTKTEQHTFHERFYSKTHLAFYPLAIALLAQASTLEDISGTGNIGIPELLMLLGAGSMALGIRRQALNRQGSTR